MKKTVPAKRLIALLLLLSTLFSMFQIGALAASRTNEKAIYTKAPASTSELDSRLTKLMNKYVGTYWTTNGKAANSSGTTSKYYYGIQCKGFASYIFNNLFCTGFIGSTNSAKYFITTPNNAKLIGRRYGYANNSSGASTVKSVLSYAKKGDFIQVRRRSSGGPHSMIVAGVSSSGITIFDCNSDGKCGVRKYTQTWATFASKNSGFSLYHSTKYPSNTQTKVTPTLTVSPSTVTVKVGGTSQLSYKVTPSGNKVTWTTSNSKIATVNSSGKVTGVKAGTVTITAKSSSGKTATCKVTVITPSLTVSAANVNAGSTVQLSYKVAPSTDKVTWSTSNKSIATVNSSGKVTGVKAGTVTITAKSSSGKTASCKVVVSNAAKKVTYFTKCASKYTSIVDALKSIGIDSSLTYRKKIAVANGISNYTGTAAQNVKLLNLLKSGKLIKP